MSGLERRIDSLEAIAEDLRLRPARALAARLRMAPEELLAKAQPWTEKIERMRQRGLSSEQMVAAVAEELGCDPADLERRCLEIVAFE